MDPSTEEKLLSAFESGDFQTALQILPKGDTSQVTLGPEQLTPLHYACQHGEVGIARQLISEYNYSAESRSKSGQTPLHIAAKYGQLNVLKSLVTREVGSSLPDMTPGDHASKHAQVTSTVNPSIEDGNGDTPLHTAAANGQTSVVEYLITKAQCKPSHTNNEEQTPLHLAAQHGHISTVRHLVDEVGCPTSPTDDRGRSPLYLAAGNGQLGVVRYLIEEKECDPRCGTTKRWLMGMILYAPGLTPLHIASQEGHLDVVQYLVREHKCDPSCKDEDDNTPIHLACLKGHLRVVQYLISEHDPTAYTVKGILQMANCRGDTSVHFAAHGGSLTVVKFLINEKQCDPMSRGQEGRTPLHYASHKGHLDVTKYLIDECHIDLSCRDKDGHTPLHFAAYEGSLAVVKFLINEKQCDPMSRDQEGKTPLHHASQEGHLDVTKYLIDECHIDLSCRDKDGHTPLHLAAFGGSLTIVKFLINEKQCDPKSRGQWGVTPLHCASQEGRLDVTKYLIDECRVDPSCRDGNGDTPLHIASLAGQTATVRFLVEEKGCNPVPRNKVGETPLDFACEKGEVDVALCLIGRGASLKNERGKAWVPLSPLVKIYIVGNSGSGKSTLAKALQDENSWMLGRFRNVSGITPETAGIIAIEFQSTTFGKVTLYDFAGHEEYFASHEAIFEGTSLAVVLITADLTASTRESQKGFRYWQFVIANTLSSAGCHAHIIAVGTHSDLPKAQDMQSISLIMSEAMKHCSPSLHHIDCVSLDARKSSSAGMRKLRQLLQRSCRTLRGQFQLDHHNGGLLYVFITQQLRGSMRACTFSDLLQRLLMESRPQLKSLKSPPVLYEACETLNRSGHLLFLKNKEVPEESWVILDQQSILFKVHGILKHIKPSTHNTGLVPLSQLENILKQHAEDLHPDLAIRYMLQMEFCKEIDPKALMLITSDVPLSQEDKYLFFPDLISAQRPKDVWANNSQFTNAPGWRLKCTEPYQFFTPRFLQVLLIHLACKFALHPHPTTPVLLEPAKGCRLWKNGIRWLDAGGVETVVELTDQSTVVTVLMRSLHHGHLKHSELRSSVIGEILSIQETFCHAIKPKVCLLVPIDGFPPLELSMMQVTKSILQKDSYVIVDDETFRSAIPGYPFLPIDSTCIDNEPYKYLKAKFIAKLFDEQAAKESVKVGDIAAYFCKKWQFFAKVLNTPPELIEQLEDDNKKSDLEKATKVLTAWSARDQRTTSSSSPPGGSYARLRHALEKYSIFAGRNPLDFCPELKTQNSPESDTTTPTAATASPQNDDVSNHAELQDAMEKKPKMHELKFEYKVVKETQADWEDLAYALHFDTATVRAIKRDAHDVNAACTNVLSRWLDGEGERELRNWSTLLEALKDMEKEEFAKEITKKIAEKISQESMC